MGGYLASESLVENLLNQQKNIEFLVEIWKMLVSKAEYAELCLSLKQPAKRWKCRNNKLNESVSLCKNKGVLMWKNLQAWLYNSIALTWRNKLLENDICNWVFIASLLWFKHFTMSENTDFLKKKFYLSFVWLIDIKVYGEKAPSMLMKLCFIFSVFDAGALRKATTGYCSLVHILTV